MNDNAPLGPGTVEPHASLLTVPPDRQLLYKVMSVKNLLRSIVGSYLHFNRVDGYSDVNDGQQLPKDQPGNAHTRFEKAPDFSGSNYYNRARQRTYACCFSLENTNYIWENYGNDGGDKVCVVFDFGKLRATLNQTLRPGNALLKYNDTPCQQFFDLNYGIVRYVDWAEHQENAELLPNPIVYTYLKDKALFEAEKELRISLSAPAIWREYALDDKHMVQFPPNLHLAFDFTAAITEGTIQQVLIAPDVDILAHAREHGFQLLPLKGILPLLKHPPGEC